MNISIILGHPNKESFNHAIADAAVTSLKERGHTVMFHDLYAENFKPLLSADEIPRHAPLDNIVRNHCDEIARAHGIIIVHPNWWGQPPAILKGWVDRVIRPGIAYEFLEGDSGEGVPCGLLNALAVIIFNTSNTPQEREQAVFGDPLETIWKNCVFGLCGVANFYRRTFSVVVTSTEEQRKEWLNEVQSTMKTYFP